MQFIIKQRQAVTNAQVGFGNAQGELLWRVARVAFGRGRGLHGDRELGTARLLATEQIAYRFDSL